MNIFFTSDEHFDHDNIIKFCNRPFANTEEMQEKLIENHNSIVKKGDYVYHLGDMFWKTLTPTKAMNIMYRLNGRHQYIWGNHDKVLHQNASLREMFVSFDDIVNLRLNGYPNIVLCHYAMKVWNGSHRGAWHLYGHTHATLPEDETLSFDVGVDAQNFYPISLEDVKLKMDKKLLKPTKMFTCVNDECKKQINVNYFGKSEIICTNCSSKMIVKVEEKISEK